MRALPALLLLVFLATDASAQVDFSSLNKWKREGAQREAVEGRGGGGGGGDSGGGSRAPAPDPAVRLSNEKINKASAALQAGDHRTALRYAREALEARYSASTAEYIERLEAAILVKDAEAAARDKDLERALRLLRESLAKWPQALNESGKRWFDQLEKKVEWDREQARLKAQREADQSKAHALNREAARLIAGRDYRQALEKARQAMTLDPNQNAYRTVYYVALTQLRFDQGDYEGSAQAARAALSLDPGNRDAKDLLALIERKRAEAGTALAGAAPQAAARIAAAMREPAAVTPAAPKPQASVASAPQDWVPEQVEEIRNSPGAFEAVRAMRAITRHDWKSAAELYGKALAKDPGNKALRRMVDLAEYTRDRELRVNAAQAPSATAAGGFTPADYALLDDLFLRERARTAPAQSQPAPPPDDRTLDEFFFRQTQEEWADEFAGEALRAGTAGDRKKAIELMREAAELAPWRTRYADAYYAMSGEKRPEPAAASAAPAPATRPLKELP